MGPRLFLTLFCGTLAFASLAAVGIGVWLIDSRLPAAPEIRDIVLIYGGGAALLLIAVIVVLWAYVDRAISQPLSTIVQGIRTVVYARSDYRIDIEDAHRLDGLPGAVNELIRQLGLARNSVNEAIDKATASIEQQKNQLATILMDLHEGVLVCTLDHRILLYNNRALQLLRIGLDRSLFHFMTRQPILHALNRLNTRLAREQRNGPSAGRTVPFVGSTTDGKHTLQGRMSLMLLDAAKTPTGYVLSFEDHTDELAALGLRDRLLREATEGLRAPVGNLGAAVEILVGTVNLSAEEQAGFKKVLLQESQVLSARLERLAAQYRDVITGHWPMSDIYSSNLLQTVADRVREQRDIIATIIGLPQWLHGDSYSLIELLGRVIARLSGYAETMSFDLEAVAGDRLIYLDVIWSGGVLPASELNGW